MGSGKSTVTRIFTAGGAIPIHADKLARVYTEEGSPILSELVSIFGSDVLENGKIPDRKLIASMVFTDPEKLKKLTSIIHPLVREKTQEIIREAPGGSIIAWEVPLLFETGGDKLCSHTIVVSTTEELAFQRVRERDGLSKDEFLNRMKNQMSPEEKRKRAMFHIENNGSLEELERKSRELYQKIRQERQ